MRGAVKIFHLCPSGQVSIVKHLRSTPSSRRFLFSKRTKPVGRRPICSAVGETLIKPVEDLQIDAPKEIFLKDYKKPGYYFDTRKLLFFSKISVIPRVEGSSSPLILNGQDLKLISLKVTGKELKMQPTDGFDDGVNAAIRQQRLELQQLLTLENKFIRQQARASWCKNISMLILRIQGGVVGSLF
ncbi:hypothetical protein Droror1_Dr00020845 [Drosera rotundifolia]